MIQHMLRAGGLLGLAAVIGTALVAITYIGTYEKSAENEREFLMRSLTAIVPESTFDNDIFNDTLMVMSPKLLGTPYPVTAYRARRNGNPVAVVLTPIAPDGYNGNIKLLIAIRFDGSLGGVRVVAHRETPGLGDDIEIERSNWITSFNNHSLGNLNASRWRVKKDGGKFDQFTGATITPRAIVKAVYQSLQYYSANRDALFAVPLESEKQDEQ